MPDLETLIASIFYLMTRHSQTSKANVEQAIVDHLKMLATHPDCNSSVLKDAGNRLSMTWRQEARTKVLLNEEKPAQTQYYKAAIVH